MIRSCIALVLAMSLLQVVAVVLAGNIGSRLTGDVQQETGTIGAAMNEVKSSARGARGDLHGRVKNAAAKASEQLGGSGALSGQGVHGEQAGFDAVKDTVQEFLHEAMHAIPATTRSLEENSRNAAELVPESVPEIVSKGKDAAQHVTEHAVHEGWDQVEQAKEQGKRTFIEAEEKLWQESACARGKATGAARKISEKAEELKDKALSSWNSEENGGRCSAGVGEAARRGIESVVGTGTPLGDAAKTAKDTWSNATRWKPLGGKWLMLEIVRLSHLLSYAIVYGASFWNTFVSASLMSPILHPKQMTVVQGRMLPVYYKLSAVCNFILLASYFLLHPWGEACSSEKSEITALVISLVAAVGNLIFFEPLSMWLLLERQRVEKEERERSIAPPASESDYQNRKAGDVPGSVQPRDNSPENQAPANLEDELEVLECIGVDRVAAVVRIHQMASKASTFSNMASFASLTWHAAHLASRLVL